MESDNTQETPGGCEDIPGHRDCVEVCLDKAGSRVALPSDLCSNPYMLDAFFQRNSWEPLVSPELAQRLRSLMPDFSGPEVLQDSDDEGEEQERSLDLLVSGRAVRFGQNPLEQFKASLLAGQLRPKAYKVRQERWREEYK
jgi:hypothetical protein